VAPAVGRRAGTLNAETQARDPRSTLALTRRLGALRSATPALQTGEQVVLDGGDDLLAWVREEDGDRLLAVLNFAAAPVPVDLAADLPETATLLVSTDPDREGGAADLGGLVLAAGEGVLLRL
jgi:alpha-glucosidase